ncbi:apolipoprotein N-acyltransferase [Agrococcus sp. Marseille-P2731]|uniref:apolipoprotein N-acyltransferase n=1 Tax=Agrococcus sp. Marseille-P2731 TaxID=1841862 RepID=UPI0009FB8B29|nr:apolipoprotein N-acyltransferase [Agrococcus sp. Marseille-P2731]
MTLRSNPISGAGIQPRARRTRARGPLPSPYAWGAAILAGAILPFAFQPFDWWALVVPGVALAMLALRGRSLGASFALGFTTGLVFFLVHIQWITVYLGPVPLIALTVWMAIWWGLGGMAIALGWRWGEPRTPGPLGAFLLLPLLLGALWTLRESLSSSVPWGGFAWGRLAHSQASSPLADTTSWVGFSGLTFLLAVTSALVAQLVLHHRTMLRRRLTIGALALIALVAIPAFPVQQTGSIRVGAVQGDSEAGLLAPRIPGEILQQHIDATRELSGEELDLLVWPENAGEFYADETASTIAALDRVTTELGAPLVVGTVTRDGDDAYNALLQVEAGEGAVAEYRKRHPVPFAEYLPQRELFAPILDALGFLELIPRDFSIDPSSANAFDVAGTVAGLAICFDIIDDYLAREMVLEHGAEIILAPTNNADFGEGSAENVQQLAIAQLRAVEAGRAVVNISTVGTSAMVAPDGTMIDRLPQYAPGTMLEELPLSTTVTPGIRLGAWIDWALCLGGALALAGLGVVNALERRRADA